MWFGFFPFECHLFFSNVTQFAFIHQMYMNVPCTILRVCRVPNNTFCLFNRSPNKYGCIFALVIWIIIIWHMSVPSHAHDIPHSLDAPSVPMTNLAYELLAHRT